MTVDQHFRLRSRAAAAAHGDNAENDAGNAQAKDWEFIATPSVTKPLLYSIRLDRTELHHAVSEFPCPATAVAFPLEMTEIAGQPIPDLARQFGTPVYVYDAAKIAERIADLAAFDVVRYAQKACSNLAILDLVRRHGGAGRLRERRRSASGDGGRLQAGPGDATRRRSSTRPTSSIAKRSTSSSSTTFTSTAARPT